MNSRTYQQYADSGFADLEKLDRGDLETLLQIHVKKIEFHREERKMHFGALALVTVLLFFILTILNAGGTIFIHAGAIGILLLCLIVPYVIVYFKYENGLRKMNNEYFKILDAMQGKDRKL